MLIRRQSRIFLASPDGAADPPRHRASEAQCGIALPGEGRFQACHFLSYSAAGKSA